MKANDKLVEALEAQIEYWHSLPSGVDEDADPDNPSPVDATAHVAGLAVRAAKQALVAIREELNSG